MCDVELLDCPFCGSEEITVEQVRKGWYSAFCGNCEAEGPPGYTHKDARLAWNGRPKQYAKSAHCNEKSDTCLASRPAEVDDEGLPPQWRDELEMVAKTLDYFGAPANAEIVRKIAEQYRQGQRDAVAADRARRGDGWISVDDERKPEAGEVVLLYVRTLTRGWLDDTPCEAEGAQVEMGEYRHGESDEMSYFDCYASPISDNDWITHWRKMPAAPSHTTNKEKGGENGNVPDR